MRPPTNKTKSTMPRLRGGVLVGQGQAGCAFSPPLTLDESAPGRLNKLGKVTTLSAAQKECARAAPFHALDTAQAFGLYPVLSATAKSMFSDPKQAKTLIARAGGEKEVLKCQANSVGDDMQELAKGNLPLPLDEIIMEKGTSDLGALIESWYSADYSAPRELEDAVRSAMRKFRNLLAGLALYHRSGNVHYDIKPGNIVEHAHTLKFIDFGISFAVTSPVVQQGVTAYFIRSFCTEAFTLHDMMPAGDVAEAMMPCLARGLIGSIEKCGLQLPLWLYEAQWYLDAWDFQVFEKGLDKLSHDTPQYMSEGAPEEDETKKAFLFGVANDVHALMNVVCAPILHALAGVSMELQQIESEQWSDTPELSFAKNARGQIASKSKVIQAVASAVSRICLHASHCSLSAEKCLSAFDESVMPLLDPSATLPAAEPAVLRPLSQAGHAHAPEVAPKGAVNLLDTSFPDSEASFGGGATSRKRGARQSSARSPRFAKKRSAKPHASKASPLRRSPKRSPRAKKRAM